MMMESDHLMGFSFTTTDGQETHQIHNLEVVLRETICILLVAKDVLTPVHLLTLA